MKTTYLDNGFYIISQKDAKILAKGKLPAVGWEKNVFYDDNWYWLARTIHYGKIVWAIRKTSWHMKNGNSVLSS
jgi:hypothetical protein